MYHGCTVSGQRKKGGSDLSIQKILGILLLLVGVIYGIVILAVNIRDREVFRSESGRFSILCILEGVVYFFATLGISDFLLNTLVFRHLHLGDDKKLPGTLCAACLVPGAVIACFLLQADNPVELHTLIPCAAAITVGSVLGSRFVGNLEGKVIKKALGYALIASMAVLIIRIVLTQGTPGTLSGLYGGKLIFAVIFSFFWGAVNMLGVPMKPAGTAMFLLLGVSPLNTLTLVLVMCCIGPFGGGIPVLKRGNYQHRQVCAAVTAGVLGAVLGSVLALSLNALMLNVILLAVMLVAVISIFKA